MQAQVLFVEESDPLGILEEIKIFLYSQMVCAKTKIFPWQWNPWIYIEVWDTNWSPNLDQKTRLSYYQKE